MKILDCTLRDGGYYTNWDFSAKLVDEYILAMNALPVDYLEVGYRNNPSSEYLGKFGYSPVSELEHIRSISSKKIAIMLNEKNTTQADLDKLLKPIQNSVDMVRLAVDPKNFDRAVKLAEAVKNMGFEVGFNTMYMSKWSKEYDGFLQKLSRINSIADLFCMVDSFGGVTPEIVAEIYHEVKSVTTCPIGFHGHNNLQMGLINTITAKKLGVDFVDATVMGMGRGAGNLNIELLLTYLNSHEQLDVDFNVLGNLISSFSSLMEQYRWGTNLPYMLAGANNIPQKEVMDWVTNRVYSFNSVVRALDNRKNNEIDNAKFPVMKWERPFEKVIVVGGGCNVIEHESAIKEYVKKHQNTALVFATARHARNYLDVNVPKFYCLVGNEGQRLTANVGGIDFTEICVLPPYPRTMGTEVPDYARDRTYELPAIDFTDEYKDSVTTLALQLSLMLTDGPVYVVGYDGYPGTSLSEKERCLTNENKYLFETFVKKAGRSLISLTPTLYKELVVESIYQFL